MMDGVEKQPERNVRRNAEMERMEEFGCCEGRREGLPREGMREG